jgi:hypothetical protein
MQKFKKAETPVCDVLAVLHPLWEAECANLENKLTEALGGAVSTDGIDGWTRTH